MSRTMKILKEYFSQTQFIATPALATEFVYKLHPMMALV